MIASGSDDGIHVQRGHGYTLTRTEGGDDGDPSGSIVVTLLTAIVVMSSTLPGSVVAQGSAAPSAPPSAGSSTAPHPTPGVSIGAGRAAGPPGR